MDSSTGVPEVVAAVIERRTEEGVEVLIGRRKPEGRHPLKWEFPGGKVEAGEQPRDALVRELREELGIEAQVGEEIERYDFSYAPGRVTRLIFFRVRNYARKPENLDFAEIAWVRRTLLAQCDFLEGDVEFVNRLSRE